MTNLPFRVPNVPGYLFAPGVHIQFVLRVFSEIMEQERNGDNMLASWIHVVTIQRYYQDSHVGSFVGHIDASLKPLKSCLLTFLKVRRIGNLSYPGTFCPFLRRLEIPRKASLSVSVTRLTYRLPVISKFTKSQQMV